MLETPGRESLVRLANVQVCYGGIEALAGVSGVTASSQCCRDQDCHCGRPEPHPAHCISLGWFVETVSA